MSGPLETSTHCIGSDRAGLEQSWVARLPAMFNMAHLRGRTLLPIALQRHSLDLIGLLGNETQTKIREIQREQDVTYENDTQIGVPLDALKRSSNRSLSSIWRKLIMQFCS